MGHHFATFFAKAALETLTKAWERWNTEQSKDDRTWPSIKINIKKPDVGVKVTPYGVHPKK